MKKIAINLLVFQVGWAVCVIGGDLYAVAFTLPALMLHNWLILGNRGEWRFIVMIALAGCLWDITMVQTGTIQYANASLLGIPLWLLCLWLLFATTFMHALFWLHRYLWLAAVFAAVLGPASYWFGTHLTEARLDPPIIASLGVMAVGWAVLFPFGMYYAGKIKALEEEAC
ncbi:MAG: DUF2878 domain-containing protein [Gammaproteobacteria bacterium]|nr:MAG: DUF2878 domain-containing protein [Gammaproteobacteria bacterium]